MSIEKIENAKIVYKDEDYTKVVYGSCEIGETFVEVTDKSGRHIHIGKRFIISIIPRW